MFSSMTELKSVSLKNGYKWFDTGTMRFWSSHIATELHKGKYFVSREANFDGSEHLYTIREASGDGAVSTVGEFQAFQTRQAAIAAMKKLA